MKSIPHHAYAARGPPSSPPRLPGQANEAAIRKSLTTLQPQLPKIDEVRPGPMPGLWEVRFGNQIVLHGRHRHAVFDGGSTTSRNQRNLTEERVVGHQPHRLQHLPLKDALMEERQRQA